MFNYIDIILIAIIGITAFAGYKLGLVKMAVSLLSFFVAVGVALFFYKPLAVILTENTKIDDYIINHIIQSGDTYKKEDKSDEKLENSQLTLVSGDTTTSFSLDSVLGGLPDVIIQNLDLEDAKAKAKYEIAKKASELIMNLLSLIVIYFFVRITLLVASILLTGLMKNIPILNKINEVLGLLLGIILGIVEVYILFSLITFLSSIADLSSLVGAIKASFIAKFLFENNLLIKLLF